MALTVRPPTSRSDILDSPAKDLSNIEKDKTRGGPYPCQDPNWSCCPSNCSCCATTSETSRRNTYYTAERGDRETSNNCRIIVNDRVGRSSDEPQAKKCKLSVDLIEVLHDPAVPNCSHPSTPSSNSVAAPSSFADSIITDEAFSTTPEFTVPTNPGTRASIPTVEIETNNVSARLSQIASEQIWAYIKRLGTDTPLPHPYPPK
jgi:hypothetical protein